MQRLNKICNFLTAKLTILYDYFSIRISMETKYTFDLKDDWNYLPSSHKARGDKKLLDSLPKSELDGLKYDVLRGFSWEIKEEKS